MKYSERVLRDGHKDQFRISLLESVWISTHALHRHAMVQEVLVALFGHRIV